jgi:hypothetical protein
MQTYKKVKKGEKHTLYLQKQGFCLKMIFSRFNRYKRHLSRAFCDAKKISTINFQSTDSFILATLRERKGEEKKTYIDDHDRRKEKDGFIYLFVSGCVCHTAAYVS